MTNHASKITYKHVCPTNCPSSCTMISHVNNNHLIHLTGDPKNPYTNGKLCAKGFSFLEKNSHRDRLKFPYYQEIKGTGKFKQITWEYAFDLIVSKMVDIYEKFGDFRSLALHKGIGNIGVHHYVVNEFFSSIGETTRIIGSPSSGVGMKEIVYDAGNIYMSDPTAIVHASMIIIWGANPAATNIHLIPLLIEARTKGAKIVVIDPIYTQTAELADLFIQLIPSTDGALANLLIMYMIEKKLIDKDFLVNHFSDLESYLESLKKINPHEYLLKCGVVQEAIDLLLNWIKNANAITHIIGSGLQKHSNSGQNIRAIEALAVLHGDIGKLDGGILLQNRTTHLFNNQRCEESNNRNISLSRLLSSNQKLPIEMMWVSCANPLSQYASISLIKQLYKKIPFVVTVDQFLTPTAQQSNLILPTTTQFEEFDIIINSWHKEIFLNEKAVPPYYESRSEWNIMKELALRLNQYKRDICTFPIHSTEEEYLDSQFNQQVWEHYYIKSISDMNGIPKIRNTSKVAWSNHYFTTKIEKYQFCSEEAKQKGFSPTPIFVDGKSPTAEFPFWLITPHHPYRLNSQFHYLHLSEGNEAFVEINSNVAKQLGIFNGEVIKVFNEQDTIEIKAVYSEKVPKDILMIYQGWYSDSQVNVNRLIPNIWTNIDKNAVSFYDTFVNVKRWKNNTKR